MSMTLFISSSVKLSIALSPLSRTPALLIRTSTLPNLAIVSATTRFASSAFDISLTTGRTSPPASRIFAATSSSCASRRAVMTTFAPSAANFCAVAAPTPELPPVIMATFPSKRFIERSSLVYKIFILVYHILVWVSSVFSISDKTDYRRCKHRAFIYHAAD